MKKEIFIAKTFAGLEMVLAEELSSLGAENCEIINRGVKFEGNMELLYKTNYFLRSALRILWQVDSFCFRNNQDFYKSIFNFPSEKYLLKNGTLAISATVHDTIFKTPLFASLLAKDAICDRFRERYNERPSVNKDSPDVQFHLHIHKDQATLFLDSSGESLHKRGYRVSNHPAPINEVVAAGMLALTGWKADCDLVDFMCGSGTLLIEGAMKALNVPAGYYRADYGFFSWLNFDAKLWKEIQDSAEIKEDIPIDFYGSDVSGRWLKAAIENVAEAGMTDFIRLRKMEMFQAKPKRTPALVLLNPPYGERLEVENITELYKRIGYVLKQNFSDCTAFIISSDFAALKSIGLHPSKKYTLYNGQLECRFVKYELYKGKKDARSST